VGCLKSALILVSYSDRHVEQWLVETVQETLV
jgi:hypothetical protein